LNALTSDQPLPDQAAPRILLYSHDSFGLGHLQRTRVLAAALVRRFGSASCLIVSGSPCATHFPLAPRVGVVKLPSITKDTGGAYSPRELGGGLDFTLELRRRLLLETFRVFAPHLVIVDHQVIGLKGEALPVLREARARGVPAILGVRDIIDAPEVVAREWGGRDARWALAEGYERVCVYGSPRVFDARAEYPIPPELARRLEYVGYVVGERGPRPPSALPRLSPEVVVTIGGGEDGGGRVQSYLDALELAPVWWHTSLVLGPLAGERTAREVARRARRLANLTVHGFHPAVPALLADATAAVAMCGYNTAAEMLQARVPCVYLPRTQPRREQELRARRLAGLELAQCLIAPQPEELRRAIERALAQGRTPPAGDLPLPLDGAERVAEVAAEILGAAQPAEPEPASRSAQF
jgi:predicted glycosyltransferase